MLNKADYRNKKANFVGIFWFVSILLLLTVVALHSGYLSSGYDESTDLLDKKLFTN